MAAMSAAAVSVLVYDEAPGQGRTPSVRLALASERMTVRQLIESRVRAEAHLDPDAQCRLALEAFEHNRFFLLVDDRQVDTLDEEIVIRPDTEIGFFKLVPLVGG
jgi:hypothetical protein